MKVFLPFKEFYLPLDIIFLLKIVKFASQKITVTTQDYQKVILLLRRKI